jgi:hypothetical protein
MGSSLFFNVKVKNKSYFRIESFNKSQSIALISLFHRNKGSQDTLHRRLMRLCASGYLRYSCDIDGRKVPRTDPQNQRLLRRAR